MTDWKLVAQARQLSVPPDQVERIAPVLNDLEETMRKLREALPYTTEPAVISAVYPPRVK